MMICAIYGPKCKHANNIFGKKSLNVPFVKLFSKYFFQHFWGLLVSFWCRPLIKGKYIPIWWFITFYCLKMALEFEIFKNSLKNKKKLCICP